MAAVIIETFLSKVETKLKAYEFIFFQIIASVIKHIWNYTLDVFSFENRQNFYCKQQYWTKRMW